MVWPFKKGKKEVEEEIPELPELPPLPELDYEQEPKTGIKDELPPLPSFPSTPTGEKISHASIKHTIKPTKFKVNLPKTRTREIEEEAEPTIGHQGYKPIVKEMAPETPIKEFSPPTKPEPIFVRIDKYQQALSQFQEIKKRIAEIDNLLRNIREIKTREEAELQQWEQEIQDAKSKLNSIDKTIFNKID